MCRKLFYLIPFVLVLSIISEAPAAPGPVGGANSPGWRSTDIGNTMPGEATFDPDVGTGGTFSIKANGGDIWGGNDRFTFVHKKVSGNCEFVARVVSIGGPSTNGWRKAGCMIRKSLADNSHHTFMCMTAGSGNGASLQWRSQDDGDNNSSHGTPPGYGGYPAGLPFWIAVRREGDILNGWTSATGLPGSWTKHTDRDVTNAMGDDIYVGIAVTSHEGNQYTTCTFDNVSFGEWPENVYGDPYAACVSPKDGTFPAPTTVTLSWLPGEKANKHDVWLRKFGDAWPTNPFADDLPLGTETIIAGGLSYKTQYEWTVDEYNDAGPGDPCEWLNPSVWTFKTLAESGTVIDINMVAYYKLDGDATDSSGYDNHGTVVGTPDFVVDGAAQMGKVLMLDDQSGEYINCGNDLTLSVSSMAQNFSAMCWVKTINGNFNEGECYFVSKRAEDNMGWAIQKQSGQNHGRIDLRGTSRGDDMDGYSDIADDEWHHIAATYNGITRKLFIDGVIENEAPDTGNIASAPDDAVTIGTQIRVPQNPDGRRWMRGYIDEVRIYNRALSDAEVVAISLPLMATKPVPEDSDTVEVDPTHLGATGDTYVILNYTPPPDAVSYRAYFSTNKADVDGGDAGHLLPSPTFPAIDATGFWVGYDHADVPVFARTPLALNTQHFWRVDVKDSGDTWWNGLTWSFTTSNLELWPMDPPPMAAANVASPSDGAEMVNPDPSATVEWSPSVMSSTGYFMSYGVHWGTNETAVASAPNTAPDAVVSGQYGQPAPQSYGITGLPRKTKIYWRLDTRLQKETETFPTVIKDGNVWEFTTDLPIADVNCVGHWKLEDDGLAPFVRDFSGYGNHGTIGGDPQYQTDAGGTYMEFDGSGDYVNCGNPDKLNDLDIREELTVACWIRSSDFVGKWRSFVSKRGEGRGWQLRRRGGNPEACFTVRGTSGDGNGPRGSTNLQDGVWHHVAGTFSSSLGVRVLYVDGQVDDSVRNAGIADAGLIAAPHADGRDKVVIGGRNKNNNNDTFENFVTADIDDVWIFNRALKPTGIQHIMNIAQAWNPRPDDDETEVTGTTLVWNPGEDPGTGSEYTTHKLYFGDSYSDVLNKGAGADKGEFTDVNEYPIPYTLTYCRQYYWKVVEVGTVEVEGPLWSFWIMADPITDRGTIDREYWLNMTAGNIDGFRANYLSLPPTAIESLNIFEFPDYPKDCWRDPDGTDNNNYGNRIHGWLYPETTGDYTFYITHDDDIELLLSTDETPGNAVQISAESGSGPPRRLADGDTGQSPPITLQGGERYYIELLHREGGGGDHFAVFWSGPDTDDQTEVICGCKLAPFMNLWAYQPYPAHKQKNLPLPSVTLTWKVGIEEATGVRYPSQRVYVSVGGNKEEAYEAVKNAGVGDAEDMGIVPGTDPNELLVYFDHYDYVCWRVDGIPSSGPEVPGSVWYFTGEYDPTKLVDPNLVIWYKFEGDACDSSGYANHGTLEGDPGPTFMAGWDNLALDLDGDDDFVSTGLSASFLDIDANSPKSVCAWVYTRAFNDGGIFDVGNQSGGQEFCLRTRGGLNQWLIQYWGGNYDHQFSYPTLNEWVHFTQCYADSQTDIYVNGEWFLSDVTNDGAELNTSNNNPFQVGCYGFQDDYFDGLIDDFRLYNKLLYAVDVEKIFRINMAWAWWPEPRIGLTDVSINPTLNWRPGDFTPAGMHYVYFGTDPLNLPEVAGPQAANDYTPSQLDLDTEYFWQIGEANALAPNGKDDINPIVWRFTTVNNRIIDDFDLYDNTPDTVTGVWNTWHDGYGTTGCNGNGTGSAVDAEESTVTSEPNAMSLEYDNDGYYDYCPSNPTRPKYSVAKAEVSELPSNPGPNWLEGKARALVLNFHGVSGNSIEPMWVELTDSQTGIAAVKYGPPELGEEVNDVNEGSWHEWNIDLAEFAAGPTPVDLTDVNSIAIIIGDDALPDANGTVIFDDISLYARRCVLAKRPLADLDYEDDDCIPDQRERNTMMADWLLTDETSSPLIAWYKFDGDADDSSGNEHHGVEVGDPCYFEVQGVDGNSIELNGAGDLIDVDHGIMATDAVSLAFWFMPRDLPYSGGYRAVMHTDVWNAGAFHFHLRETSSLLNVDWNNGPNITAATACVADTWYHVALTLTRKVSPAETKIYLNGDLDNSNSGSSGALILSPFSIGGYQGNSRWVPAAYDDFQIYNRVLTEAEINTIMDDGVINAPEYNEVPSPANLVDPEPVNFRSVNFSDFAELMMHYLDKQYFPLAE